MSKISNKARYQQLKEWMESRGNKMTPSKNTSRRRFSKTDYYKGRR